MRFGCSFWNLMMGKNLLSCARQHGHSVQVMTTTYAVWVKELPPIHKDPFDRLLVAQARFEPMILLTDDDVLGGYGELVEVV